MASIFLCEIGVREKRMRENGRQSSRTFCELEDSNSCYGNQKKRANEENRNSRVVLRIKDYECLIATVYID